jgi:ATP-dependent exoDNAse (exonuclease V) beta subunit
LEQFLAATFTIKAAQEMWDRLKSLLEKKDQWLGPLKDRKPVHIHRSLRLRRSEDMGKQYHFCPLAGKPVP